MESALFSSETQGSVRIDSATGGAGQCRNKDEIDSEPQVLCKKMRQIKLHKNFTLKSGRCQAKIQ